jgi:hypothetical protein
MRINEDIAHKKVINLTDVTKFKKMESIYSRCKWEYKVRGGKIST